MGLDMASELTQNWTQNDPPDDLPDWSRDDPPDTSRTLISSLSHMAVSNEALFEVLLTIAEVNEVSSKDWIRPPT